MSPETACRETRDLLPELALGVATGDERARALAHVGECPACRTALAEMSVLADELLLLAPPNEPRVGFESRVLDRLGASAARRPRRKWWITAVVAAAVGVLSAVGALAVTQDERELGTRYERTLRVANGSYFSAARLRTESGTHVGHVFGYQGSPSWTFVVVWGLEGSGRFDVSLETTGGRRIRLGSMSVTTGSGSWGATLPVDLHDVSYVEVVGRGQELHAGL
jgi:hypothetical protein